MQKIELTRHLDPDWGSVYPLNIDVAKAVVQNPNYENGSFVCIMIMPSGATSNVDLMSVATLFLSDSDGCEITKFSEEDADQISDVAAVISFHPRRPGLFFWLKPPPHLRN